MSTTTQDFNGTRYVVLDGAAGEQQFLVNSSNVVLTPTIRASLFANVREYVEGGTDPDGNPTTGLGQNFDADWDLRDETDHALFHVRTDAVISEKPISEIRRRRRRVNDGPTGREEP